jgi:ribosome-binding factor A
MHRIDRLQEEFRHAVSSIILYEVTDPRLRGVTITRVMVTKDIGIARVYYETTEKKKLEREGIQKALERAAHFIRKELASKVNLRNMPNLEFFFDETNDEVLKVERLFAKL